MTTKFGVQTFCCLVKRLLAKRYEIDRRGAAVVWSRAEIEYPIDTIGRAVGVYSSCPSKIELAVLGAGLRSKREPQQPEIWRPQA